MCLLASTLRARHGRVRRGHHCHHVRRGHHRVRRDHHHVRHGHHLRHHEPHRDRHVGNLDCVPNYLL